MCIRGLKILGILGLQNSKRVSKRSKNICFVEFFLGYTSTSPKRTSWWFNLYLNQSLEANPLSVRSSMTKTLWSLCENCIGPANKLGNFSSVLEVLENPWYNFGIFSTMGLRGNLSLMNFCKSLKNITVGKKITFEKKRYLLVGLAIKKQIFSRWIGFSGNYLHGATLPKTQINKYTGTKNYLSSSW